MQRYKVVEISPVDELKIEENLNTLHQKGWEFERIEFVQQPGVRRPVFAYLFFVAMPRQSFEEGEEEPTDETRPHDEPIESA